MPWMKPPGTICPWTRMFERISNTGSACGEQLLYYQLRCPAMNEEEYRRRAELIRLVEEDPHCGRSCRSCSFVWEKAMRPERKRFSPRLVRERAGYSWRCCCSLACLSAVLACCLPVHAAAVAVCPAALRQPPLSCLYDPSIWIPIFPPPVIPPLWRLFIPESGRWKTAP